MSTKINVRSPYFLEFQEPTPTLGTYDCDVANLRGFSVSSAGVITEPVPVVGHIIDRTDTSFAENTSGSSISRTVTYTLEIPFGYSNYDASTIECDVTADQPTQTAQEDPNSNDNCPTFSGTIPNVTDSTSTTVDLSTYFTAGSGASISSYVVSQTGSSQITYSISGNDLTISSAYNCVSANFTVLARNSADACTANSNTFTFSSPCTEDLECSDIGITGGKIYQNGDHAKATFNAGYRVKELLYNGSVITSPYNVGANTSGSPVDKVITYRMYIPQGWNNYSVGATIDCPQTYSQPSTQVDPTFDCAEADIKGIIISTRGTVAAPTSYNGTLVSWTPQSFDSVTSDTSRTITVTITPPATGYSNSGGANITCDVTVTQPGTGEACGNTALHLSAAQAADPDGLCGINHITRTKVYSTALTFNDVRAGLGDKICTESGSIFRGGNNVYGYSQNYGVPIGGNDGFWTFIRIDDNGIVQDVGEYNCSGTGSGGSF